MACAASTWTPTSLQLRFALGSGTRRRPNAIHLGPSRLRRISDYGVMKVTCASQKPEAGAWNGSDSPPDALAGWSDSGNGEKSSPDPLKKSWIQGVVGAGVAGIILVAGLSYAAASLSKLNKSRPQQEMQPLTAQEEPLSEENNLKDEDGISKDDTDAGQLLLPSEVDDVSGEKESTHDSEISSFDDLIHSSNGSDVTADISSQDQPETGFINEQSDPHTTESDLEMPKSNSHLDSSIEDNLKSSDESNPADSDNLSSEILDNIHNIEADEVSDSENNDTKLAEHSNSSPSDVESYATTGTETISISVSLQSGSTSDPEILPLNDMETASSSLTEEIIEVSKTQEEFAEETVSSDEADVGKETSWSKDQQSPAGIPAPCVAIRLNPGKILVPAAVDQVQYQALSALQVLKVIETDAQPSDLCTRREYARWLVSASSALSRNTSSKVYPAMYIENITELAFDDISVEDPDFSTIQGLAEAGLIASRLSNNDLFNDDEGPFLFSPDSPLSRQDLISWKMALEKRQLPEADKKLLYQISGFIDIDKINPDALPALIADLSSGEQGVVTSLAFGCTRLFQPNKPVTKAQAAIALASGEASDVVSEELARIEAESVAENAVAAHNALVAEVEKDINASFEKELSMEREKIETIEKMAEQARLELEQLRAQREEESMGLVKERAVIESEMELLSRLRREVEEQLQELMSNKAEIAYEKETISKLRKDAEDENQQISKLQYDLQVERKALSMARSWAEDEAKRAREQGRALEEARQRWETKGLRVIVGDEDLKEKSSSYSEEEGGSIWVKAGEGVSVEETEKRAQTLVENLREMADKVVGKSRQVIDAVIKKILEWVNGLKELKERAARKAVEMREGAEEEIGKGRVKVSNVVKRIGEECRDGVGKISHKFKT